MSNTPYVLWFKDIRLTDIPKVGGKNAALGEMYANLTPLGVRVPNGFAVTAAAYDAFLLESGLRQKIAKALRGLNTHDIHDLQKRGAAVRQMILEAPMPVDIATAIAMAYRELGDKKNTKPSVAVRSSATAEDLPDASFAGQQETYLNISGVNGVTKAVQRCIASLFTDRAISYRHDKGFSHFKIALSVGVQLMVRSDKACSGVMFTLDTETGLKNVIEINASWGLGEMIVQGKVTPDEFIVFKPRVAAGHPSIIGRTLGSKDIKMIYSGNSTKTMTPTLEERSVYCLSDKEVFALAKWGVQIEQYFTKLHKKPTPMDIEWAKDGLSHELYIVQARPETVQSVADRSVYREYHRTQQGKELVRGAAVGAKIAIGKVRIIKTAAGINQFKKGEVLVTEITDPDWEPIMKIASAIVTDKGGRTSHAAIVSRELGIPCLVGTENATKKLKNGQMVTVDCTSGEIGTVLSGALKFSTREHRISNLPKTRTKIMVNVGSPDEAFREHFLPVQGVGLGRLEFIINEHIKVHPNALIEFKKLQKDASQAAVVKQIEELTYGYKDKSAYYVDKLAEGVARIAAAFWPHDVIIRFSDFKTNEYRTLIGGEQYEPKEENPMLGWRGASRYYDPKFTAAFRLECLAIRKVRDIMGLTNVVPMVPFCRTPEEGRAVVASMAKNGLDRENDKTLRVYVMCEIPSNILLVEDFLKIFDGMSIGSNDLTQLTMGIDRDSSTVNHITNENNLAVKKLITTVIRACKKQRKYIGICGQAPSDYPDFAAFLVREGITSISLNPDTVIKTTLAIAKQERSRGLRRWF